MIGQRLSIPRLSSGESGKPEGKKTEAKKPKDIGQNNVAYLTETSLRHIMASTAANAAMFLNPLRVAMKSSAIELMEQQAAFLAQICVESGGLHSTEENLNYSAHRAHQVWPKRFRTIADAQPYAHNGQKLGDHVYANRLGNGDEASGDGYKFRGRGLIQVTGRKGYRAAGFESQPEALAKPDVAALSAARFWQSNGLNEGTRTVLNRGQSNAITLSVNGGTNGSDDRWLAYKRALVALSPSPAGSSS